MSATPVIVTGGANFAMLANEIAKLIELAVEGHGLGVDEAVSIATQVAADYGRSVYGNEYLARLAALVIARGDMPLPAMEVFQ